MKQEIQKEKTEERMNMWNKSPENFLLKTWCNKYRKIKQRKGRIYGINHQKTSC